MVASLLKIVSTGMQDERLQPPKDQPDLGAFLTVMMKTGRYGTAWARIDFDTKPEFGQSAVIRLPVQGELIGRIVLVTTMPDIKTQQDKAYRERKVPKLYSKNYKGAELVENFQYVPVYKTVYADSSTTGLIPYSNGYADFSGVQLDDLRVGATYTLNFSSQLPSVFSLYLTDHGLPQSTFDVINRDTLIIRTNDNFMSYSYDSINFTDIVIPPRVYNSNIIDIQWNGSQWLAAGRMAGSKLQIGSSDSNININTNFKNGRVHCIAWNGINNMNSLYILVSDGLSNIEIGSGGTLSKSVDGINWSNSYAPISNDSSIIISYNGGNGYIAWNGNYFIASGNTVTDQTQTVSGMMYSPDGINWTLVTNYTYYSANPDVKSIYPKSRGITIVGRIIISGIATLNITSTNPTTVFEIDTIIYGDNIPSTGAVITAILNSQSYRIGFQGSSDVTDQTMFDFPQLTSVIVKKIVWNGISGAASLTVAVGLWVFSDFKSFGIASSSDGIHWTVRGPEITAVDPTPLLDLCWTGYIWVAIGRFSNDGEISTSPDAINWNTPVFPNNTYGTSGALSIGASPTAVIIIGNWPTGSIVRGSSNKLGYNWLTVKKPTANPSDNVTINSIIYTGNKITSGIYIAGGAWTDITGVQYGALSYSTDGVTWTQAVFPNDLQNNGNGDPGTGFTNAIAWNGISDSYVNQNTPYSIYIAVGNWYDQVDPGQFRGSICRSVDGQDWPAYTDPGSTGIPGPGSPGIPGTGYGIVFWPGHSGAKPTPGYWIAVGNWGSGLTAGTIAISDDTTGILWTTAPSDGDIGLTPGGTAYGVASDGQGNFVVVGAWDYITMKASILTTYRITFLYGVDNTDGTVTWSFTPTINDPNDPSGIAIFNDPNAVGRGVFYDPLTTEFRITGSWTSSFTTQEIQYSIINIILSNEGPIVKSVTGPIDQEGNIIPGIGRSIANNGSQTVVTGQWGNNTIATLTQAGWIYPENPEGTLGRGNIATGILWNITTLNWVACGNWFNQFNTNYANITTFTYGLTWYEPFDPPNSTNQMQNQDYSTIIWDPYRSQWVASGYWLINNSNSFKYIITSSDGITWSTPFNYLQIGRQAFIYNLKATPSCILFSGIWYITNKFFSYSYDAISWSPPVIIQSVYNGRVSNIAWNGVRWVAAGQFLDLNSNELGGIAYSSDGIVWSIAGYPQGITQTYMNNGIVGVSWNGTVFLAYGITLDINGLPQGFTTISSDGINWSDPINQKYIPGINSESYYSIFLVWNGTIWIAASKWQTGNTKSPQDVGSFITSIDGINWTDPVNPVGIDNALTNNVYNIAYNGSIWVAVGDWTSCYMVSSYDGIQWTPVIIENITRLTSIKWNGTLWIAVSADINCIIISYDAINWVVTSNYTYAISALGTKRTLPYTGAQLFSPLIQNTSVTTNPPVVPYVKDSIITWENDPVYKNGTNYQTFLSSTNSPTFTFTATKRTQWLTFGTYYNLAPVTITLTLPTQDPTLDMHVKSDLIGPHFSWTNSLGNALINSASLRIGGVLVDTIPGRLLEILDEFQTPLERVNEISNQTCRKLNGFNQSSFGTQTTAQVVRTPLPFWFSRGDPGCFLPIDALNVDEVRLTVNFNPITSLYYTDSRATNPDGSFIKTDTPGAGLWPMAGSTFYYQDSSGTLLSGLEPIDAPGQRFLPFPRIQMTTDLTMPESYLMVEYIYLDKAEANRFRIADIQVPVVQHYTFDPVDNQKNPYSRIPLIIPNPTRDLFFYCNRYEAQGYNANFLGTRDLSNTLIPGKLWWPDVTGLDNHYYGTIKPGFSTRYSEPIRWLSLDYSETLNRYSTENVSLFRSVLPSLEQRKAPFVNRYYYNLPFGIQNGFTPFSMPIGEANLDKVLRMNLTLGFHGRTGNLTDDFVDRYNTYVFAETYNILRVYGGRGGMMFAY